MRLPDCMGRGSVFNQRVRLAASGQGCAHKDFCVLKVIPGIWITQSIWSAVLEVHFTTLEAEVGIEQVSQSIQTPPKNRSGKMAEVRSSYERALAFNGRNRSGDFLSGA